MALATSGCHLVYPFNVEPTEDAAVDAASDHTAPADLSWRDLVTDAASAAPSTIQCGGSTYHCYRPGAADIAGNANPWSVGASSSTSSEGKLDKVINQLHGAVDSLRLSKIRRTFTAP